MHIRRYILESIRTQLKTINGWGGVWIQASPPTRNAWPCITIKPETESTETLTIHSQPRDQDRTLTVLVICWLRGTPDDEKVLQDMDAAAVQIEAAMTGDFNAQTCQLIQTDFVVGEEEPDIHQLILTYQLSYASIENNPVA